jgi:hypothetical protein
MNTHNNLRNYQTASELHRPSYRHLSAKVVPTFAGIGVLLDQRNGSLLPLISVL